MNSSAGESEGTREKNKIMFHQYHYNNRSLQQYQLLGNTRTEVAHVPKLGHILPAQVPGVAEEQTICSRVSRGSTASREAAVRAGYSQLPPGSQMNFDTGSELLSSYRSLRLIISGISKYLHGFYIQYEAKGKNKPWKTATF